MKGRVLLNFSWGENASLRARTPGAQILRPELRKMASEIKVEDVASTATEEQEEDSKSWFQKLSGGDAGGNRRNPGDKKGGGVPKWLKLPGKK
jgi:tether containing UBX domain for GLUT4